MEQAERRALITRYKAGPQELHAALAGVTDCELDRQNSPDAWTVREIVHHLADGDMISAVRLRRLLAEDEPQIAGYDEGAYSRRLHYNRPIAAALATFAASRRNTAELLERLSDAEGARAGTHSTAGRYAVERWLQGAVAHAAAHVEQIRGARS